MPHRPALAHHSSRVTHHFFIAGPSPSAALRRIDIFFDERPAHSKKYRTHRIGCPFGKERSALGVTSALARTLLTHSAQRNHRFDPTSSARRDPAGEKRDA